MYLLLTIISLFSPSSFSSSPSLTLSFLNGTVYISLLFSFAISLYHSACIQETGDHEHSVHISPFPFDDLTRTERSATIPSIQKKKKRDWHCYTKKRISRFRAGTAVTYVYSRKTTHARLCRPNR
ncbi:uncharacterized protein GGS25DRAFT_373587 [Hypoxylon fragiforme]|uniref:uncharacterized protein n=1 Tax=Hypoxylon fragiforme TaxID=63214 RepID=UPI0020C727D1|nr:uncharacterized protein GGS25DRAFT_373587 [Hypoxylon fragiforme]KAI2606100.1 hypothetical protein GGS25DRAFT_373587 [Hypoxylon fragiforme]